MLENQAESLPWPERVPDMAYTPCLEMPENKATSLPWPGHVPDMACTPCPEMPENQVASLPWPGRVPDTACTPCPKTAQKCRIVPAMAWTHPGYGMHTVSRKLPRNA
ncbi:Hypothetical predicted protein [Olea europaea subsp. europaea]|uniref:Uncharacterized protein n=1 Tax=Olea europaea subsp. europaea TaxID=158383 RepID=A0A8S0SPA3_OLEEU|nr:Hypothetical predicted protein [Olea europaea subsp. europaea]